MRGLRLYVRPVEPADYPAVAAFLRSQAGSNTALPSETISSPETSPPAWGLLGKLLGDLVAVVRLDITPDALRIDELVVRRDLRRKWIGRAMLREVGLLALKLDRRRLVVEDARDVQEFLRRTGFEAEGERWVRNV